MTRYFALPALLLATLVAGCSAPPAGESGATAPASSGASPTAAAPATQVHDGRAIEITGNDTMKFSVTEITAKPGEKLSVTLVNIGTTPKFSMGHNWVLLASRRRHPAVPGRGGRSRHDRLRAAATQRQPDPRRDQAPRPEGARHGHVHGADQRRPLRVPLLVPRTLPGRHARRADRAVTSLSSKDSQMSTRLTVLVGGGLAAALLATAGCNPPGSTSGRQRRHLGGREVLRRRRARRTSSTCSTPAATPARSTSPACRRCATSRRFRSSRPYPATGYGFDEESKQMLGEFTWGDVHHPGLSQSDGKYDGRWLFVNDNANNRIARIDLRDFKTKQILGPIPNSSGNHGSSFVTENSEYVLVARASRCRCRRAATPIRRPTRPSSTAWSAASRLIRRPARWRRLADPHAAVQLGPRIDRQGPELGLGVLDLLQLRDGAREARSHLDAGRTRLRRRRQLARSGAGGQGRQGDA